MAGDSEFWFSIPINFLDGQKYVPSRRMFDRLGIIPRAILRAILVALPPDQPIDPLNCFLAVKTGRLPPWVVIFFIRQQHYLDSPMATKFFRALHLIEWVRADLLGIDYRPPTRAERRSRRVAGQSEQTEPDGSDGGSDQSVPE